MIDVSSKTGLVRMLIENTPIAYVILDRNYRIRYVNKSFADLRGLHLSEMIGRRCYDVSNGGDPCPYCVVKQAFDTNERAQLARKDTLRDGSVRYVDDYAFPLEQNEAGEVLYVVEIMIDRTKEMLMREQKNQSYDEILGMLSALIEAKDTYTARHSDHVRTIAINIARKMGIVREDLFEIAVAASLHDIGKIGIPNSIINKPGKLTKDEFDIIKTHPVLSYEMLQGFSSCLSIMNIVRHHHERVDGTGYPDSQMGKEIPLGARIIAVADTYDAITSTRSYREEMTHEFAVKEIKRVAGTQLDESAVQAFLSIDFEHLPDCLYDYVPQQKEYRFERTLRQVGEKEESGKESTLFQPDHLEQEEFLQQIFANTPCGYFLIDKQYQLLYASEFYMRYMGLLREQVMNTTCYITCRNQTEPCKDCSLCTALESGKNEQIRQERMVNGKSKIFELFAVPLLNEAGGVEQIIGVMLDRTEEAQAERMREQDLGSVIRMLDDILSRQEDILADPEKAQKVLVVRNRAKELLKKCI